MTHIIPHKNKGITHFTIVKILKRFSPEEINEFEKMLNSPFFNNHSTIIKLFGELIKFYPEFSDKILTKEYLFSVVNKGKKYDDKIFRKYLSRINKLAEEYLNILQMRLDKDKKELNVLLQLSNRNIKDVYSRKLKEIEKSFEKNDQIDPEYFFNKHRLSAYKFNHKSSENQIKPHNDELIDSLQCLLNYFLFYSNSLICQIESNKYSFNIDGDTDSVLTLFNRDKIEKYILKIKKTKFYGYDNIVNTLFLEMLLYDMEMNSSDRGLSSYNNLKNLINSNSKKLSKEMLYYYLQKMNVFCIIQNANGKHDMHKELFENHKMILDNDLFNINGRANLTLLDFRIILTSALKNNEYEWAERFIESNIKLIKEDSRSNIYNYGYARLQFHKKNYPESLNQISKIKSESHPIKIDIYILKAKIFYMLGHFDSALSIADSFRHFISGNKLMSDFHKNYLMNFLKYYKSIIRLKESKDKAKTKKLLTELQKAANTRDKNWIIEKTEELLSR